MIKIFDQVQPWPYKVNFVDSNNVVLGYDMNSSCCELVEWKMEPNLTEAELIDYVFDTTYFDSRIGEPEYEEGGWARFKLVSAGKPDVYITLSNVQNGYYSHGFDFSQDKNIIQSGEL